MSHDERIRQLSDLFMEDLRGPVEASLRTLLAELMGLATQERASAVSDAVREAEAAWLQRHEAALGKATADHQAAHDAALHVAAQQRDLALEALEASLVQQHEEALEKARAEQVAAVESARLFAAQQRDLALEALEASLEQQHEEALEKARAEQAAAVESAWLFAEQQRALALEALEASLVQRHEEALATAKADHQAALDSALQFAAQQRDQALDGVDEDAVQRQADALDALRAELAAQYDVSLAGACRDRDTARANVSELTDLLAAARAQHEHLAQIADAESVAAEQMAGGGIEARAEERLAELACSDRLLAGIERLDEARALSDVLTVLAEQAASLGVRAALFLVQGGRLRGWRTAGMGDVAASAIDLPVERAGALGHAVRTGARVSTLEASDVPADALPPFLVAPPGRTGLALPIVVGGHAVAILYADGAADDRPAVPSNWPEIAEMLVRHAARCLEVLTLSRAAGAAQCAMQPVAAPALASVRPAAPLPPATHESDDAREEESARRHARLLISEIKLYNETAVEQGRREGNLLDLLGPEIERARRLYEEKIPAAVRQRVDCFDEEIVRTLAGGDRALLGQVT
jgi:hypothetical protein